MGDSSIAEQTLPVVFHSLFRGLGVWLDSSREEETRMTTPQKPTMQLENWSANVPVTLFGVLSVYRSADF